VYIYGKPFKQRDGWHYWGHHIGRTPEIVGPFKTADEAQAHAEKHGHGKPPQRASRKSATR
jgi:hypothetical protein